jgi:hypothetical protein
MAVSCRCRAAPPGWIGPRRTSASRSRRRLSRPLVQSSRSGRLPQGFKRSPLRRHHGWSPVPRSASGALRCVAATRHTGPSSWFLATLTAYSSIRSTGLLHPAADHEVHRVARTAVPLAWSICALPRCTPSRALPSRAAAPTSPPLPYLLAVHGLRTRSTSRSCSTRESVASSRRFRCDCHPWLSWVSRSWNCVTALAEPVAAAWPVDAPHPVVRSASMRAAAPLHPARGPGVRACRRGSGITPVPTVPKEASEEVPGPASLLDRSRAALPRTRRPCGRPALPRVVRDPESGSVSGRNSGSPRCRAAPLEHPACSRHHCQPRTPVDAVVCARLPGPRRPLPSSGGVPGRG